MDGILLVFFFFFFYFKKKKKKKKKKERKKKKKVNREKNYAAVSLSNGLGSKSLLNKSLRSGGISCGKSLYATLG